MNILNTLVAIGVGVTLCSGSAQARSLRSAHHHFERWGSAHRHHKESAHIGINTIQITTPRGVHQRTSKVGIYPSRHEGTNSEYSHESQRHPHGNKHKIANGWHSGNFFREWRAGD